MVWGSLAGLRGMVGVEISDIFGGYSTFLSSVFCELFLSRFIVSASDSRVFLTSRKSPREFISAIVCDLSRFLSYYYIFDSDLILYTFYECTLIFTMSFLVVTYLYPYIFIPPLDTVREVSSFVYCTCGTHGFVT